MAILSRRRPRYRDIIKCEATSRIEILLGRWRTAKNLADVIDDGVTSGAQFANDFDYGDRLLMVCHRNMLYKPVRDKTKRFTQKRESLTNDVALGKDILDVGREERVVFGGERRVRKVVRVMRRKIRWTRDDLREGSGRKRWRR